VASKLDILTEHCADVGRDIGTIEKSVSFPMILRDDPADAAVAYAALMEANGVTDVGDVPLLLCSPDEAGDRLRPYADLGFTTVIVRMPAPYDPETIARMVEVAERTGA
jgi:alkanesulfonate monooxygenase SsuD/methylene tetrahydromethanopterin reductase-like flavin-dependent oxidoreductase (luciferase family)